MTSIFTLAATLFRSVFSGRQALILENLALRQQLAVYQRMEKRPRLRSADRAFWVCLSRVWDEWKTPVPPENSIHTRLTLCSGPSWGVKPSPPGSSPETGEARMLREAGASHPKDVGLAATVTQRVGRLPREPQ